MIYKCARSISTHRVIATYHGDRTPFDKSPNTVQLVREGIRNWEHSR